MSDMLRRVALMMQKSVVVTYATWNPSDKDADISLSGSNLVATCASLGFGSARSTIGKSSGKWYWEVTRTSGGNFSTVGVGNGSFDLSVALTTTSGAVAYRNDGTKYIDGTSSSYGSAYGTTVVVGVYLDMNAGTVGFLINNVDQGIAATGLSGTYYATVGYSGSTGAKVHTANFGASTLTYTPPSGYNSGLYT